MEVKDATGLRNGKVELHLSTRASVYKQENGISGLFTSLCLQCRCKLSRAKIFLLDYNTYKTYRTRVRVPVGMHVFHINSIV